LRIVLDCSTNVQHWLRGKIDKGTKNKNRNANIVNTQQLLPAQSIIT